jgi:hypothetical protein
MRALCYRLEDLRTVVLQPEGSSAAIRVRLAARVDPVAQRDLFRAAPERPVGVELELDAASWDHETGLFRGALVEREPVGEPAPEQEPVSGAGGTRPPDARGQG